MFILRSLWGKKKNCAPSYIAGLLLRYYTDDLSDKEQRILAEWVETSSENRQLLKDLEDVEKFVQDWESYNSVDTEEEWIELQQRALAAIDQKRL